MYKFLGFSHVDFTDRKSGDQIVGYNVWFMEHSESGIGWQPFKHWLSEQRFQSLFGTDTNKYKQLAEAQADCQLSFGRKDRLEGIEFPGKKQ